MNITDKVLFRRKEECGVSKHILSVQVWIIENETERRQHEEHTCAGD